jgi:hypothetical protein
MKRAASRASRPRAAKGGATVKAGGGGAKAAPGSLRVRMYRVGFGDFFLLTVPTAGGPQHVLIDCGVTSGTTGRGDIGTIKAAVADMAAETKSRLALVIVTHRHMDHIIGFSRSADVFGNFTVGAVWMPTWETEYDAHVAQLQDDVQQLAFAAQSHLALASDALPGRDEMLAMLENATGNVLAAVGTGGGSNAASLQMLKHGFGVEPKYYCKGQKADLPAALADGGLAAEILGPPPADALAFMKLKDLKKGVGQYLHASEGGDEGAAFSPFAERCVGEAADYPACALREWSSRGDSDAKDASDASRLEQAVQSAQPSALLTAVKQLDDFLNNQSLVVLFTWQGKKLLFAGDAQAGNWEYWLYGGAKATPTPGATLGDEGAAVLSKLDFYKCGHHGSTNATPVAVVENLGDGFTAMCSTEADTFGSEAKQSEIPRKPLLEAMEKKGTVVCSYDIAVELPDQTKVAAARDAPAELPKPTAGRFETGPCYIDYLL